MKKYILAILLGLILLAGNAFAETGSDLLVKCKLAMTAFDNSDSLRENADEYYKISFCIGYIEAIADSVPLCFPPNSSIGQGISIFVKYADSNPNKLHENASHLVIDALSLAYPCK